MMVLTTSCSYSYAFPTRIYYTHNLYGKEETLLKNNIHFLKLIEFSFVAKDMVHLVYTFEMIFFYLTVVD